MDQEEIYRHLWAAHDWAAHDWAAHDWAAHDDTKWDQSLHPRSPDFLFDVALRAGINSSWTVLDIGCGHGQHVCELSHRFGCQTFGLEPLESNLKDCAHAAAQWNVANQVEFVRGSMEVNPFASDTFDFIWCRDMLVHVSDLKQGLRECARVLKPSGILLVLTTFATDFMEEKEQNRLCDALDLKPENLSQHHVGACFEESGFKITSSEWLGSELAEFYEERDGRYSKELKRLARMNRHLVDFETNINSTNFAVLQALYTWGVYQLLGKLGLAVYKLEKRATR